MKRNELIDRFRFDDDLIVYDKVSSIPCINPQIIHCDGHDLFFFERYFVFYKKMGKSLLIGTFQKAGAKFFMKLNRAVNNDAGQSIQILRENLCALCV